MDSRTLCVDRGRTIRAVNSVGSAASRLPLVPPTLAMSQTTRVRSSSPTIRSSFRDSTLRDTIPGNDATRSITNPVCI